MKIGGEKIYTATITKKSEPKIFRVYECGSCGLKHTLESPKDDERPNGWGNLTVPKGYYCETCFHDIKRIVDDSVENLNERLDAYKARASL